MLLLCRLLRFILVLRKLIKARVLMRDSWRRWLESLLVSFASEGSFKWECVVLKEGGDFGGGGGAGVVVMFNYFFKEEELATTKNFVILFNITRTLMAHLFPETAYLNTLNLSSHSLKSDSQSFKKLIVFIWRTNRYSETSLTMQLASSVPTNHAIISHVLVNLLSFIRHFK